MNLTYGGNSIVIHNLGYEIIDSSVKNIEYNSAIYSFKIRMEYTGNNPVIINSIHALVED